MSIKWELFGRIQSSQYRIKIMQALSKGEKTPVQLEKETDIKLSHVSRTLKDLVNLGVVIILTPSLKKGRIYGLTNKGKKIFGKLN